MKVKTHENTGITYITAESMQDALTIGKLAVKVPGAWISKGGNEPELQCETVKLIKIAAGETP